MGVKVKTTSPFGGAGATNSFSDTFIRANTTSGLGTDWTSSIARPASGAFEQMRILTNQVRISRVGGAGANIGPGLIYYPRKVVQGLYGLRQFAQWQFVAGAGAGTSGPSVMVTSDVQTPNEKGYYADCSVTGTLNLFLVSGTTLLNLGGPFVGGAANDVIRIDAVPTAASNTVRLLRNGTVLVTAVDASANRPVLEGIPAIWTFLMDIADTYDWGPFSCGPF